jgi:thiamine biosynthesis lipoprotein
MLAYRTFFEAMGGAGEIVVGTDDEALSRQAAAAAIDEVRRIETKYSRYRADSVIGRINALAGTGTPVACDAETNWLLDYADQLHRLSDGLFDITSGVLRQAWDFAAARLPAADEVERARARIGWSKVTRCSGHVLLDEPGMEIDFGGFGKEYAADCAGAALRAHGIRHGYANLGGDIHVVGPQPDGSPWLIGIRDPRTADEIVATIPLSIGGLATSGDYERYFEVDGRRYCHVLNPFTGYPVSCWRSMSVCADTAVVAGSYSTVAMLKEDAALPFLDARRCSYFCIDNQERSFSR